jgi:hypothetical protein
MAKESLAKLHPTLRSMLAQASPDDRSRVVRVLIRLSDSAGSAQRLKSLGFTPGGQYGAVVAGTVSLSALVDLAADDDVAYVEGAQSLYPDDK